ncbi:MAG: hypothetical protein MJZ89_06150 [Paludibacteraceae bacterium]|nr:hypothetical protein [Paludibacteraceae bacterium]
MKTNEMRSQDIVVLLKKTTSLGQDMSARKLADSLFISVSTVSECLKRSQVAQLLDARKQRVNVLALEEFLVHGVKYVFPVQTGRIIRGVPTFLSASPMKEQIASGSESFVWASLDGTERGQKVQPLYSSVPKAVQQDDELYRLLVLVDTLRLGRVRECEIAAAELHKHFEQ